MASANEIKSVSSLNIRKFRKEQGLFVVEGPKLIDELLSSSYLINTVFASKEWMEENNNELQQVKVIAATTKELQRMSALQTANQVLATVEIPEVDFDFSDVSQELSLMLDGIGDPGNMGTIIRTADWFGIKNVFCVNNCVDVFNPKVVQASMGSVFRVNVFNVTAADVLDDTPDDFLVYGADMSGEEINKKNNLSDKGILIIGNESRGISENVDRYVDELISIPSSFTGETESLNAAVATAILCYEFKIKRKAS